MTEKPSKPAPKPAPKKSQPQKDGLGKYARELTGRLR
jgi:hypothetical protein